MSVNLTGILGTFDIQVDALGLLSGHFRVNLPGKFSLRVAQLTATVPGRPQRSSPRASPIAYDPAGPADQKLVVDQQRVDQLPGLQPHRHDPALRPQRRPQRRRDQHRAGPDPRPGHPQERLHPRPGRARLRRRVARTATRSATPASGNAVSLGNILTFKDIRVGVQNFSINFSGGHRRHSTARSTSPPAARPSCPASRSRPRSARCREPCNTDGTPNTEALRLTLTFTQRTGLRPSSSTSPRCRSRSARS